MRRPTPKRTVDPDLKFNNLTLAKFINLIMDDGKKSVAQKIVYNALNTISEKTKQDPLEIFQKALQNIAPEVEVRGRRVGGANYQVPVPVSEPRRTTLGLRWLIKAAKARKGISMDKRIAAEIMDAAEGHGAAVKKREDTYKMAEANRAFAHFARR